MDLEATCWEDRSKSPDMETIEIGAVKLDAAFTVVEEFQAFIRPVVEPILSDLCRNLTGITQEQVDGGSPFPEAFQRFLEWVGEPLTLATWGRFDVKQLDKDCARHDITVPGWLVEDHVNLRKVFEKRHSTRCPYISDGIAALGLDFDGRSHSGIDDARNAARIFAALHTPTSAT